MIDQQWYLRDLISDETSFFLLFILHLVYVDLEKKITTVLIVVS